MAGQGAGRVILVITETTKNDDRSEYVVENSPHIHSTVSRRGITQETCGTRTGNGWCHLYDITVKSGALGQQGGAMVWK